MRRVLHGDIVAAAQQERFSRKKHDHRFPVHAAAYSERPGTPAARLADDVPLAEQKRRLAAAMRLVMERLVPSNAPEEELRRAAEGLEASFALLLLSPYRLTRGLLPLLKAGGGARVMIDEGVLVADAQACFYVYRLRMGDHVQHGLVVGASVDEYENDLIKKHEHTRADKEADRTRHVETLGANAGPVFLTYRAVQAIDALVVQISSMALDPTPPDMMDLDQIVQRTP